MSTHILNQNTFQNLKSVIDDVERFSTIFEENLTNTQLFETKIVSVKLKECLGIIQSLYDTYQSDESEII